MKLPESRKFCLEGFAAPFPLTRETLTAKTFKTEMEDLKTAVASCGLLSTSH